MEEDVGRPGEDPAAELLEISRFFSEYFATWGIVLPANNVRSRRRGEIQERGWQVQYLFGKNESGEYLDFYACHRMSDDRHVRVYASGKTQEFPAYSEIVCFPPNATEDQQRQVIASVAEHDREVAALLEEKGFSRIMFPRAWEW